MAACAPRALLWALLALLPFLLGAAAGSERHGLPARHITVRRQERSPGRLVMAVTPEGGGGDSDGKAEAAFQGDTLDKDHGRRARRSLSINTAQPLVNVVSDGTGLWAMAIITCGI